MSDCIIARIERIAIIGDNGKSASGSIIIEVDHVEHRLQQIDNCAGVEIDRWVRHAMIISWRGSRAQGAK